MVRYPCLFLLSFMAVHGGSAPSRADEFTGGAHSVGGRVFGRPIASVIAPAPKRCVPAVVLESLGFDVVESADASGVPLALIWTVMAVASRFNPDFFASDGRRGLFAESAQRMASNGVTDETSVTQQLRSGLRTLRALSDRSQGDITTTLSAYFLEQSDLKLALERYGSLMNCGPNETSAEIFELPLPRLVHLQRASEILGIEGGAEQQDGYGGASLTRQDLEAALVEIDAVPDWTPEGIYAEDLRKVVERRLRELSHQPRRGAPVANAFPVVAAPGRSQAAHRHTPTQSATLSAKPAPQRHRAPETERDCTDGYRPCIPPGPDVDCAGGSGNGPRYVRGPVEVFGDDPYDLDRDHDGVGCER